jgi:hypothetical protein
MVVDTAFAAVDVVIVVVVVHVESSNDYELALVQVLVLEPIRLELLAWVLFDLFVAVVCGKAKDYQYHFSR